MLLIRRPPRSTRPDTLLSLHDALPIYVWNRLEYKTKVVSLGGRPAAARKSTSKPRVSRLRPADQIVRVPLPRSEEHTSELQSLMRISYAVFCLKKKII